MKTISELRPSPIAGIWYEANPTLLARQIDGFMEKANQPAITAEVMGVISPHAGYRYSGKTAGYAFRALQGRRADVIAVVSPMHNYHPDPLLSSAHAAYSTPLGAIAIDRELLEDFSRQMPVTLVANDQEHSLEIELPFLQRAITGTFKLLPLMVRADGVEDCEAIGSALAKVLSGKKFLLVASTDLSHFYPLDQADELDEFMLGCMAAMDPPAMFKAERENRGFACGLGAVASVIYAAKALGATSIQLLNHSTSANETSDPTSVVGYGAAAILK